MSDDELEYEGPSKTQIKREYKELHNLGKQLLDLPVKKLRKLSLSEDLLESVLQGKNMERGALKRQMKYIGGVLVEEDTDKIRLALEIMKQPHHDEVNVFHEIEKWRDDLIAGDQELLNELVGRFQQADRQYMRQLVRNATREIQQNKPPKSSKILFKYLKELLDSTPE